VEAPTPTPERGENIGRCLRRWLSWKSLPQQGMAPMQSTISSRTVTLHFVPFATPDPGRDCGHSLPTSWRRPR